MKPSKVLTACSLALFALVGAAVFNSTGRNIADIHISATPTVFAQARFLQPSL